MSPSPASMPEPPVQSGQPQVFLASKSPRRHQLLSQIGVPHRVLHLDLDERQLPEEPASNYALRLAMAKARAGVERRPLKSELPVLAADTAVVVEGEILGKPRSLEQMRYMMERLSGRTHQVMTGVALGGSAIASRLSVSDVTFRRVSTHEAEAYWATGEPHDKAGGYGIQGLGAIFVSRLQGSYSGVMGLPLFETAELLQQAGIIVMDGYDRKRRKPG